jgi:uncharacterized membrane protein YGL010W
MSAMDMTLDQIKARGYAALMRELGPVGYVRFMQQFVGFKGDYTKERQAWIDDLSLDDLKKQIGMSAKRGRSSSRAARRKP